ncbi:MAG: TRAP transporter fused permease subunit [Proteobacteria bacterium]|nr:TRAP transporter fused permease subunit [Pseudomonadota bacterium]
MMTRGLQGFSRVLCIGFPLVGSFFILDIPSYIGWSIIPEEYYGIALLFVLGNAFLVYPAKRGKARDRVPWYDVILCGLGCAVGIYVTLFYRKIIWEIGVITPDRVIMGLIAVLLVLEGARRASGWIIVFLGAGFILYGRFTWLVPGMFGGEGIPWNRLLNYIFLDPNGLLGLPMQVAAYIILAFVLFGNFLFAVGGGGFVIDFSQLIFGRFRGGPAKVAIAGSSLFGTISGSAVANVATTGVITIPMMKRIGYKPHMAGAIEAVASTGGQLMPPFMGAAAFVMAEFIGVPYREIAIAAIVPSLLFYAAVYFQVDLEAARSGLKGLSKDNLPHFRGILPRCYSFFIPLLTLLIALFALWFPAGKAAIVGVISIILVGFFQPGTRFRFGWMVQALESTGRGLIQLFLIISVASFVIGILNYTGLGFVFTMFLGMISGKNVILLLFVAASASMILGMGMPTTAVYILLASLMASALVEAGINVMAAHLFIIYTAMLSMITPPVALAAFTAANLARSSFMQTGFSSMRLGVGIYVLPFLFAIWPILLLKGSFIEVVLCSLSVAVGFLMFGCAFAGYLFNKLTMIKRVLAGLAGIGFIILPVEPFFTAGMISHILGGLVALGLLLWEWRVHGRKQPEAGLERLGFRSEPQLENMKQ